MLYPLSYGGGSHILRSGFRAGGTGSDGARARYGLQEVSVSPSGAGPWQVSVPGPPSRLSTL